MNHRRRFSLTTFGLGLAMCFAFAPTVTADGTQAAPSTDPDHLGTHWWQLVMSIPGPLNPFLDETGASCGIGQRGNTWFLYSSSLGPVVDLKCTIPAGKTIFVAVVTAICVPFPGETIQQNVQFCKDLIDVTDVLSLRVDGEARNDLIERRAVTRAFSLPLPDDNVFAYPSGIFAAVFDGYFAKLPPLEPGYHTVRVRGAVTSENYSTDTRYRLHIVKPDRQLPTVP